MESREEEITLDIRDIFHIIRKRIWLIIIITAITTLISGLISFYVLKPVYESKISIVIAKTQDNIKNPQYDYNDIMMYQNLIKTYSVIAKSRTVAQKTLDKLGLNNISPEDLQGQITVTPKVNTQIMELAVRDLTPIIAKDKVDALSSSFIEEAKRIFPNGNVQIIDSPVISKIPVSPNKKLNIVIAFFLGLMVSIGLSFMMEYLDNTIKSEADVEKYIKFPVLGVIPKEVNKG